MLGGNRGYERVPQNEDAHSLHAISTNYNYGSGIVIPSSPPPSFHSSTDATFRPNENGRPSLTTSQSTNAIIQTPSSTSTATSLNPTHTIFNDPTPPYRAALTSNALASLPEDNDSVPQYPPTIPDLLRQQDDDNRSWVGSTTDIGPNSLTLNLHRRAKRLEETVGRLLIANDELRGEIERLRDGGRDGNAGDGGLAAPGGRKTTNCCVSFYDDESARLYGLRDKDNCCVFIGGNRNSQAERARARQMKILGFLVVLTAIVLLFLVVVIVDWKRNAGLKDGNLGGDPRTFKRKSWTGGE